MDQAVPCTRQSHGALVLCSFDVFFLYVAASTSCCFEINSLCFGRSSDASTSCLLLLLQVCVHVPVSTNKKWWTRGCFSLRNSQTERTEEVCICNTKTEMIPTWDRQVVFTTAENVHRRATERKQMAGPRSTNAPALREWQRQHWRQWSSCHAAPSQTNFNLAKGRPCPTTHKAPRRRPLQPVGPHTSRMPVCPRSTLTEDLHAREIFCREHACASLARTRRVYCLFTGGAVVRVVAPDLYTLYSWKTVVRGALLKCR